MDQKFYMTCLVMFPEMLPSSNGDVRLRPIAVIKLKQEFP